MDMQRLNDEIAKINNEDRKPSEQFKLLAEKLNISSKHELYKAGLDVSKIADRDTACAYHNYTV